MDTLGIVESRSIAAGAELADGMLKAANVALVRASTICSGRYLIFISGSRQAVATSVDHARGASHALLGSFVISNVSPQIVEALGKSRAASSLDALAVIECRTVAAGIAAADAAVKRSDVRLLRIVTGQGINGKSYFVLGGDVAAVREAAQTAESSLGSALIESVVLPRPEPALAEALTSRKARHGNNAESEEHA